MPLIGQGNGLPNPNTVPPDTAVLDAINAFTFKTTRRDMSYNERLEANLAWDFFNYVWAYNVTVSTINGGLGPANIKKWKDKYQFLTPADRTYYVKGFVAHQAEYPDSYTFFCEPR
jgi:hypothetical protein